MAAADRRRAALEHPQTIFAHDFVRVGSDFDGVVVGLEPDTDVALVHEYDAAGEPTARLHEVALCDLNQHETGRNV